MMEEGAPGRLGTEIQRRTSSRVWDRRLNEPRPQVGSTGGMTWLYALFTEHGWWIFFASVATFVASVVTLPILVVRMPADYFVGT